MTLQMAIIACGKNIDEKNIQKKRFKKKDKQNFWGLEMDGK